VLTADHWCFIGEAVSLSSAASSCCPPSARPRGVGLILLPEPLCLASLTKGSLLRKALDPPPASSLPPEPREVTGVGNHPPHTKPLCGESPRRISASRRMEEPWKALEW
jgi:hypothetical protein